MPLDITRLNQQLAKIFENGQAEVGLEMGSDIGLAPIEFIQIPKCMKKQWCALIDQADYQRVTGKVGTVNIRKFDEDDTPAAFVNEIGWITSGEFMVNQGIVKGQYKNKKTGVLSWVAISEFHIEPPTIDDMRAFYTVNKGHVRDLDNDEDEQYWIHAIRYWSVVGGLVMSSTSKEFVFVDNPLLIDGRADAFAEMAMGYSVASWTACAARATSWRRTNHATGGEIVQGYPRKWMIKENRISEMPDKNTKYQHEKKKTSCFYVATHATSVHATLSFMAPSDNCHWAIIDPSCGCIMKWNVGLSTTVRMAPKDQVAGTAAIVDSMVVLKMLTSEGLAPMLNSVLQVQSLIDAYKVVQTEGIRCAVYSKWFLQGHPTGITPISFSQHDAPYANIISELSVVATKYYNGSTISLSATLRNQANQSVDEMAKANWSALATSRNNIASGDFVGAVTRIRSGVSADVIKGLTSGDDNVYTLAANEYNNSLASICDSLGMVRTSIRTIR